MPNKNRPAKGVKSKRKKLKFTKPSRPTGVIEIDDVLRKVNHIQIEREKDKFRVSPDDAPVVENILKDAGLVIKGRLVGVTYVAYDVEPGELVADVSDALEGLEEMSDEIPEDGQMFD